MFLTLSQCSTKLKKLITFLYLHAVYKAASQGSSVLVTSIS